MNDVLKKLNHKDRVDTFVLNAPASFAPVLAGVPVKTALAKAKDAGFVIAFATKQAEVDRFAQQVAKATSGDAIVWVAYPKGSSKKYKCEFNRDTGFASLGAQGFEPVRMVAIDEDWSALRFRRVDYVKTMTRSRALSPKGQQRIKASGV